MSVAKSYEKYEIIGEPYEHDKRQYVKIKYPCCRKSSCSKCHGESYYLKEIRWYPEPIIFNAKKAFLFGEQEYIIIFKGNEDEIENFFLTQLPRFYGRYNTIFGWFIGSNTPIPNNLPETIIPIKIHWTEVSKNSQELIDYNSIRAYVKMKKQSSFFCYKNEQKFEKDLLYVFTNSNGMFFEDEYRNIYLIKKIVKNFELNEIYHLECSFQNYLKIDGINTAVCILEKEEYYNENF